MAEVVCSMLWVRINDKNEVFALKQRKCNEILLNKEVEMTLGRKATAAKPVSSRLRDDGCH